MDRSSSQTYGNTHTFRQQNPVCHGSLSALVQSSKVTVRTANFPCRAFGGRHAIHHSRGKYLVSCQFFPHFRGKAGNEFEVSPVIDVKRSYKVTALRCGVTVFSGIIATARNRSCAATPVRPSVPKSDSCPQPASKTPYLCRVAPRHTISHPQHALQ